MHDITGLKKLAHLMIVAPDRRIIIVKNKPSTIPSYTFPTIWRATLGGVVPYTSTTKAELLHLLYIKFNLKFIELNRAKLLFVTTHTITQNSTLDIYILILNEMIKMEPSCKSEVRLISYEKLFKEATADENFGKHYTTDTTIACNVINRILGEIPCHQNI